MKNPTDADQIKWSKEFWSECGRYVAKAHQLADATYTKDGNLVAGPPSAAIFPERGWKLVYELLTVLDAKASALMRLNGVMTAAGTFMLGALDTGSLGRAWKALVLVPTVAMVLVSVTSMLLCLLVVRVRWHFLGKVGDQGDGYDYREEMISLQKEAFSRQARYMNAWWLSLVGGVSFFLAIAAFCYCKLCGCTP